MRKSILVAAISIITLSACANEKPQEKISQEVSGDAAKVMNG